MSLLNQLIEKYNLKTCSTEEVYIEGFSPIKIEKSDNKLSFYYAENQNELIFDGIYLINIENNNSFAIGNGLYVVFKYENDYNNSSTKDAEILAKKIENIEDLEIEVDRVNVLRQVYFNTLKQHFDIIHYP